MRARPFRLAARRALIAAWVIGMISSLPSSSEAQRRRRAPRPIVDSVKTRTGVKRGEALLAGTTFARRLRGVDRLASLGTDEAIEALAKGMAPGSSVRLDPRTRLAAVRALAPHVAKHPPARRVLVSVLNSVRAGAPESPLALMVRATAANALAQSEDPDAIAHLVSSVVARGRTGALAREALVAYPPKRLGPLAKRDKTLAPQLIALLGDLGDARVLGILRKQLRRKSTGAQWAAALALAKLGDGHAAPYALKWIDGKDTVGKAGTSGKADTGDKAKDKSKKNAPAAKPAKDNKRADKSRLVGAEVLMWLDSPKAAAAIAKLLGDARSRKAGLALAERSLSPALVPTLAAVIEAKVTPAERLRAATILAKIGSDSTAKVLLKQLARPELATVAAFGLAGAQGDTATEALGRALAAAKAGAPRRLILRAGIVRFLQRGVTIPGLTDALAAALAASEPADRAVGALGSAIIGAVTVKTLLGSKHPEVVHGASRASLSLGRRAMGAFGKMIAKAPEEPDARAVAASVALWTGGHGVPTSRLLAWAESGQAIAPVAAFQFARRDSKKFRQRLIGLLEGTDAIVRLHVALGLAESPEKDAVALLTDAYRFEPDARVRRAIVVALSQRGEKRRDTTLSMAARFDPDPEVRGLAATAAKGRKHALVPIPSGTEVAWVSLRANSAEEQSAVRSRPGLLVQSEGLAVPLVSAPDGVVIAPGLGDRHEVSIVMDVIDDF